MTDTLRFHSFVPMPGLDLVATYEGKTKNFDEPLVGVVVFTNTVAPGVPLIKFVSIADGDGVYGDLDSPADAANFAGFVRPGELSDVAKFPGRGEK